MLPPDGEPGTARGPSPARFRELVERDHGTWLPGVFDAIDDEHAREQFDSVVEGIDRDGAWEEGEILKDVRAEGKIVRNRMRGRKANGNREIGRGQIFGRKQYQDVGEAQKGLVDDQRRGVGNDVKGNLPGSF